MKAVLEQALKAMRLAHASLCFYRDSAKFETFDAESIRVVRAAVDAAEAAIALSQQDEVTRADGMPASASERQLRRLLAVRVAIPNAYYDDGEAHGSEYGIQIDFMRESVTNLEAKLRTLNTARAACTRIATAVLRQPVAWMDDFGNAFPLAANKGAGSWLDDDKRAWKPLYSAPVAPALPPTETISIQEAWIAAGGNPGIKATREELLDALRMLDKVCDEASQQRKSPTDAQLMQAIYAASFTTQAALGYPSPRKLLAMVRVVEDVIEREHGIGQKEGAA